MRTFGLRTVLTILLAFGGNIDIFNLNSTVRFLSEDMKKVDFEFITSHETEMASVYRTSSTFFLLLS